MSERPGLFAGKRAVVCRRLRKPFLRRMRRLRLLLLQPELLHAVHVHLRLADLRLLWTVGSLRDGQCVQYRLRLLMPVC